MENLHIVDIFYYTYQKWMTLCGKGGFFSESMMRLLNLQNQKNKYSKKLSWAWNFEMLLCSKNQKKWENSNDKCREA